MATLTPVIPTNINFIVKHLEPISGHTFDDGFVRRFQRLTAPELILDIKYEGLVGIEVKYLIDFAAQIGGRGGVFDLSPEIFVDHPEISNWISALFQDLPAGVYPTASEYYKNWWFEEIPQVTPVTVENYTVELKVRKKRRIYPNSYVTFTN